MTTPELFLREAEFRERRARVLRGMGTLALATLGGIGLVLASRRFAPAAFDASVAIFLAAFAASGLAFWRTLRRYWRCPACSTRWKSGDVFASAYWNHCPSCVEPLRATPEQDAQERIALTQFALENLSREELVLRFERRRRRGALAAGAAALAGLGVLLWAQHRGWSEMAEQVVVALFAGIVAALVLLSARCPRCQRGIVSGQGRHCQRCGLSLREDLSSPLDRRTER